MAKISRSQNRPDVTPVPEAPAKKSRSTTAKPADRMVAPQPPQPAKSVPTSALRFDVHPELREVQDYARAQGWPQQGWTQLSIPWQELVFTTDGWKTTQVLKSSEVPSPFINGRISLPNVKPGTEVEFALHIGVASHAPSDIGGYRERGDVWLNNGGQNYRQTTA